jgi:hypothetical protein
MKSGGGGFLLIPEVLRRLSEKYVTLGLAEGGAVCARLNWLGSSLAKSEDWLNGSTGMELIGDSSTAPGSSVEASDSQVLSNCLDWIFLALSTAVLEEHAHLPGSQVSCAESNGDSADGTQDS